MRLYGIRAAQVDCRTASILRIFRSFRTDAGEGRAVAVEPELAEKFFCRSLISVSMRFRHIRLVFRRLRALDRERTFMFMLVR